MSEPAISATGLRKSYGPKSGLGTPVGLNGALAVGWCVVPAGAGYGWSSYLHHRRSVS